MLARLQTNESFIRCQYRHRIGENYTGLGGGYSLTVNKTTGYFALTKDVSQFTDSGLYQCSATPERQLVIIPDESVLSITIEAETDSSDNTLNNCLRSNTNVLSPGHSAIVTCVYNVSKGSPLKLTSKFQYTFSKSNGSEELSYALVASQMNNYLDHIETTTKYSIRIPDSAKTVCALGDEEDGVLTASCQLQYDEISVYGDIRKSVPAGILIRQTKIVPGIKSSTVIISRSVQTSRSELTTALRKQPPRLLTSEWFSSTMTSESSLHEGVIDVYFDVNLGCPEGWVFSWLFYESDNGRLVKEDCILVKDDRGTHTTPSQSSRRIEQIHLTCLLLPQHVGFLIAAVTPVSGEQNRTALQDKFGNQMSNSIKQWMGNDGKNNHVSAVTLDVSDCAKVDFRLVRLHIGWSATVKLGGQVKMFGRFRTPRRDSQIICYHQASSTSLQSLLRPEFLITTNLTARTFLVQLDSARLSDSGRYTCALKEANGEVVDTGIHMRELFIIPDDSFIQIRLTMDLDGRENVRDKQKDENGNAYLLSNQEAYVHCHYIDLTNITKSLEKAFYHEMTGHGNATPKPLPHTRLNSSSFKIKGIKSSVYTGPIFVRCVSRFTNVDLDYDVNHPPDH